jgi:long-chain acyl-CoA synthetase
MEEINRLSVENKLSSLEKPKDIYISKEPFSVENNILTPTFKLKRNVARDVYKKEIDQMYEILAKQGF